MRNLCLITMMVSLSIMMSGCATTQHDERMPTPKHPAAYGQYASFNSEDGQTIYYPKEMYTTQNNARFKTAKGWWFQ